MDALWLKNQLDLKIVTYGVAPTSHDEGLIEIVQDACTLAKITADHGGSRAAFSKTPIKDWLCQQNCLEAYIEELESRQSQAGKSREAYAARLKEAKSANPEQSKKLDELADNFVRSLAGFDVASYILGLADRHNDNIMIRRDGKLLHIDFGHFLGNFKTKYGIKREKASFFFTPDLKFVIDEYSRLNDCEEYETFLETQGKAYNVVRQHAQMFIVMLKMLVATGIPELTTMRDLTWMENAFQLHLSEEAASKYFTKITEESLATVMT